MQLTREALLTLIWIRFSDLISVFMCIPMLPFFVEHLLDIEDSKDPRIGYYSGLAFGIQQGCESLMALMCGCLSDRIGRRPILLFGIAVSICCAFAMAFTIDVPMLICVRGIRGIGNSNLGVSKTYVTENTDSSSRGRTFDMIMSVSGFGMMAGNAITALSFPSRWAPAIARPGSVLDQFPFALPLIILGAANVCGFVMAFLYLPETDKFLARRQQTREAQQELEAATC